jgi:hypothetical protein
MPPVPRRRARPPRLSCAASASPGARAVERGLQDWLEVAGAAVDRGGGGDHVEDLLEGEVVADLVSVLCGEKERPADVTTRSVRVHLG